MLATFSDTSTTLISAGGGAAHAPLITVQTQVAGPRQVPVASVFRFVSPLLGFDHLERFITFQTQEGPLHWLQSVEDPQVSFCLMAPFAAGIDVDMEISAADAVDIGSINEDEIEVYTVLVLEKDPSKIRTNLRAPILVCRRTGLAKQLVLSNNKLPIQFHLADLTIKARHK
jgi:flagellar assembly factor FliW